MSVQRRPGRSLGGVLLLLALAAAPPASARWTVVNAHATPTSAPRFVCPPRTGRVRCAAIEDPTRGTARRGPVAAGAITTGPVEQASPALEGSGVEGGYSPTDLRAAYALPSASGGVGQTIAVVDAFHDPKAEADLGKYRTEYGLPPCPASGGCFSQVNQTGGTSFPAPSALWAREISLDLDMVSAICPNCHILLVEAKSESTKDLAAAEEEAVKLGATEISDSYVEPTASQPPEVRAAYDHPGIPIAAAAGDEGFGVSSPAASPHVIAVGGTTLLPGPPRRGWTESVWFAGTPEHPGTGSGCSAEEKPPWQLDGGCLQRTLNDVAAVADPNTPVSAYDSYETTTPWLLLGGTSVATPIVAGAMALSNAYTRSFDGARGLYLEQADGAGGFNDILEGSNGPCGVGYLCTAGVGYDGPTGWGSLHGAPDVPPPAASTEPAGPITQAAATLRASIDANGAEAVSCAFDYGTTTAYGQSVPCSPQPGPLTSAIPVSATIGGLTAGATYHFAVSIIYSGGTASGADSSFTTPARPPTVAGGQATAISQTSASLGAEVDPEGAPVGKCVFEYGSTTSYGSTTPCDRLPGTGEAPVAVSAGVTGLTPNSSYHFRIAAGAASGTSYGGDGTFATLPLAPVALTGDGTAGPSGSATLTGTVNANGGTLTTCAFETDTGAHPRCASLPGALEGPVEVHAEIHGLAPRTAVHYRVVAANAGGTTFGSIRALTLAWRIALTSRTLPVGRNHKAFVHLRCASGGATCAGVLTLQTPGAPRARPLAKQTFSVRAGRAGTVILGLSPNATRRLAHQPLLSASLSISGRGLTGTSRVTVVLRSNTISRRR